MIFKHSATVSDVGTASTCSDLSIYGMVHKTMSHIGTQTLTGPQTCIVQLLYGFRLRTKDISTGDILRNLVVTF